MNRRNIEYIYAHNKREHYKLADDKLISKKLLSEAGFPTPKIIRTYQYYYELATIASDLKNVHEFAMKPAHGMGGGGILVFDRHEDNKWITTSGEKFNGDELYQHGAMILSGVFSLDNSSDVVMIEEKIQLDELFARITFQGIPDIRVIVFKNEPVMAMLRIPTKKSKGKANLHAGGIGLGIDMVSGMTRVNPSYRNAYEYSPDNGEKLSDLQIPYWEKIMEMSRQIQEFVPLGYMGIDYIIDSRYGPQILELNVRPGLEIQNVNGMGLFETLRRIGKFK